MHAALMILAIMLTAVTMGLALAHALELPGKLRLSKEQYLAVQPIYYPGFTIGGGVAEVGGIIAVLAPMISTPTGTTQFWLVAGALASLLMAHGIF
jgi:hypothetical protein